MKSGFYKVLSLAISVPETSALTPKAMSPKRRRVHIKLGPRRPRECPACSIRGHMATNTKKCVANKKFKLNRQAGEMGQMVLQTAGPTICSFLCLQTVGRMATLGRQHGVQESVLTDATLTAIAGRHDRTHRRPNSDYGLVMYMSYDSRLEWPLRLFYFICKIHALRERAAGASEKYMALFEKARAAAIASLLNPANHRHEMYDDVLCQRDESMKYARLLDAGQYIDPW
jgi:hypothetical protein